MIAALGERIHVIGNSCSGKSTLASALGERLGVPVIELDALNWLPGWVALAETDPEELERRMCEATKGDAWVVAGSYREWSERTFWPRLQTLIWLDLPRWQLLLRVLARSWRRYRSRELLWGTNRERFWPQLLFWRRDSLIWWIWTQHAPKRRKLLAVMTDPRFAHIRVLRLTSSREVDRLIREL